MFKKLVGLFFVLCFTLGMSTIVFAYPSSVDGNVVAVATPAGELLGSLLEQRAAVTAQPFDDNCSIDRLIQALIEVDARGDFIYSFINVNPVAYVDGTSTVNPFSGSMWFGTNTITHAIPAGDSFFWLVENISRSHIIVSVTGFLHAPTTFDYNTGGGWFLSAPGSGFNNIGVMELHAPGWTRSYFVLECPQGWSSYPVKIFFR